MLIRMLGPLEVSSSRGSVPIGGPRQQKLLALLLLNRGQVFPTERLIDELWDAPPQSARQQVHNAVGGLRRALTAGSEQVRITTTDVGYVLSLPNEAVVDVDLFLDQVKDAKEAESRNRLRDAIQHLEEAVAMWRGDALTGLDGTSITNAAASLDERRLVVIEDLMGLRLRTGETNSVVFELQQLVAKHPLRESLRGSLMQALHLSGRQADAIATYEAGRRILADELGLDPGFELQRIHAMILAGTTSVPAAPPAVEAAAEPSAKSYLPHDTSDFSGRSGELVQLLSETRTARPTALVISAIDGMGGVGKTTLAVHLAHQVAHDYPDGQFFVDLHGFTSGVEPITPEQALDALLRDIDVPPEIVPSSLDGRSALWRKSMAGRKALLIIDNAKDAAHVRPLLPGTAGVLVIVTSRRKLAALEGATPMSLDVFPHDDAIALFTKIAHTSRTDSEPEAVATAVELCGNLPLAIRIAAARLRDRTSWTVSDLVDRLRDHTRRMRFLQIDDRSVTAALKVSYRYLAPQQQRLFRLLSLHPGGDFDVNAAAALADLPLDEAEYCLESLFDDNLLKQNIPGRFHLHDLVRDCALSLLHETDDKNEQTAATERMLDYYLHASYRWCEVLGSTPYQALADVAKQSGGEAQPVSRDVAIDRLKTELGNITALARFAAQNGWHRHAWRLACAVQPFMTLRNYDGKAYALFEDGASSAQASGDLQGASACLHLLAAVCRERRSSSEAKQHLESALKLSRKAGDQNLEMGQLIELGSLYLTDENLMMARSIFMAAEELQPPDSSKSFRAMIAANLGVVHRDLGEYDLALGYFHRALNSISKEDTARHVPMIRWSIGLSLHFQGDHAAAEREFAEISRVSSAVQSAHGEALSELGMCMTHRARGTLDKSIASGRRALTLARQFEFRKVECEALISLGEAIVALDDIDRAEHVYTQAMEKAEQYSLIRYKARALEGFAHIALRRGRVADAKQHWELAVDAYPDGMADALYAKLHLASLDDKTTCFRCNVHS